MDNLKRKFIKGNVLKAEELNGLVGKINELVGASLVIGEAPGTAYDGASGATLAQAVRELAGGGKTTLTFVSPSEVVTAFGKDVVIKYNYSSTVDGEPAGPGAATYTVNGKLVASATVPQGEISFNAVKYLLMGENTLKVQVIDAYGSKRSITYKISTVSISISSTFDDTKAYAGAVSFAYTPVGAVEKTVHFVVDGREIGTTVTSISNRQQIYSIPVQSHGAHSLEVYMRASIDGISIESEHLYYSIISIVAGNNTPFISSSFRTAQMEQFGTLLIPYIVYTPSATTSLITLTANGATVSEQTVDRTRQEWSYRVDKSGALALKITCGVASKTFNVTITESQIDVHPETADLALFLTSVNRSNNEEGRTVWSYGEIYALLTAFNWATNGWIKTIEGFTALRSSGDARVTVPYYAFANDFRATGKTLEFEFETRDVTDYDAVVLSCMNGGIGLEVTAQKAVFTSQQTTVETQFKEDERVRISFVIEKKAEDRLIYVYVNGAMCGIVQYPEQDNFMQSAPAGIVIGNNECTSDIFNIRVYDNNLNRYQLLDNYIADMDNLDLKRAMYARNRIYDDYGNISYSKLLDYVPVLTIIGSLPAFKGDKVTCVMRYEDRQHPDRSWVCLVVQNDVQGTSSQYYPRKNYKFKFKALLDMVAAGTTVEKFPVREGEIPVNCFCVKADFAESSGCHNTGMARMVDFILRGLGQLTPPQKVDSRVRTTIDGYPIVIFHQPTEDAPATFLGKYNFNNDKSTQETFGFTSGCECWEVRNNTSDRVLFKSSDYTSLDADGKPDWQNDFEARYPEDFTDSRKLKRLTDWLVSAKGNPAKFKAEASQYLDIPFMLSYYTLTEFFAMVDQRAKNMFLTTYDGVRWQIIFYDNDTCLGINNEGVNSFDYTIEYHDKLGTQDVWNGEQSTLWNNLELAYKTEIAEMYASMRSDGLLTYDVCNQFLNTDQGDKWSEAVYNEDGYYKYVRPLLDEGNGSYLYAAQGSRKMHRIWWLYNRFKYMDSKYVAGDFKNDFATMRLYTPTAWAGVAPNADITITSSSGQYVNVKYGSYIVGGRTKKNIPYKVTAPDIRFNDTETIIYGASQVSSLGDLSALYAGTIDVSKMLKLVELFIGSGTTGYKNYNLTVLSVGANNLLHKLDVRNCPNLRQAIDLSQCTNIREVWAEGTGTTAVVLPVGGNLSLLHLPDTISNLTVRNQPQLTDAGLVLAGVESLTTIRWEDTNSADVFVILDRCFDLAELKLNTVRITGIDANLDNLDLPFLMILLRGIDGNGNVTQHAVMTGKCHVTDAAEEQLAAVRAAFPELVVTYDNLIKTPTRTIIIYVDGTTTPISGTKVVVNGREYTTNSEGKVSLLGGEKVTVVTSKTGYKTANNIVAATTVDRTNYVYLQPYVDVKFILKSDNGIILSGATVTCDEKSVNTNINGEATIQLSKGTYNYTASYKGYSKTGSVTVVTSNITVNAVVTVPIEMFKPLWNGNIQMMLTGTGSLTISSTTSSYVIDWGDGTTSMATGTGSKTYQHSYAVDGGYSIEIGGCGNITACNSTSDCLVAYWSIGSSKVSNLEFKNFKRVCTIGSDIFTNDTDRTSFSHCFYECLRLTDIPSGLFDNCPSVTSFFYCFSGCSSLTAIPSELFDNCPSVTGFYYCFSGCSSLTDISAGLFDSCPLVKDFDYCFYMCRALTSIPAGLFDNCESVEYFDYCFFGCSSITSKLPALWIQYYGKDVGRDRCFEDCRKAANWSDVPKGWGGPGPAYIPPTPVSGVVLADYHALNARLAIIENQLNLNKN